MDRNPRDKPGDDGDLGQEPPVLAILACLVAINLAAFALFAWDKSCARRAERRIPERTLLGISALGGSMGAYAAQRLMRHKTAKQPFQTIFRIIVVVQIVTVAAIVMVRSLP